MVSGRLEARQAALAAGAEAFVSKSSPPDQLLAALRALGQANNTRLSEENVQSSTD